ncbi:MAG: aldolase [Anaerolineae bacterium]|nr:aldolase [Anaerolineae bacterium]
MQPNPLKQALAQRRLVLGHMVMEFAVPNVAHLLAPLGLDFLLLDLEHTGLSLQTLAPILASCHAIGLPAIVRVPGPWGHYVPRCLDLGAMGIMMPNVRSADEARRFVEAAKYPPMGSRGMGLGGAQTGYQLPDLRQYADWANEQTVLVAQIESPEAVEAIDDILSVPGIDVGWVGQNDLTLNMGILGQFDDPRYIAARRRVAEACRSHDKSAGCQPTTLPLAREWFEAGYNMVSLGTDIRLYQQALREFLLAVRGFEAGRAEG